VDDGHVYKEAVKNVAAHQRNYRVVNEIGDTEMYHVYRTETYIMQTRISKIDCPYLICARARAIN